MPDRPESLNIDEALKPVTPAVPERTPTAAPTPGLMDKLKTDFDFVTTGGARGTLKRATKNMNYGTGESFNHAHEDDGE